MIQEKYLQLDFSDNLSPFTLSRREFLQRFGGGLFIFFTVGNSLALTAQRRRRGYPSDLNAYLRISEDGRVSCFTGKIEQGQGVITSLAQMLADELEVSLNKVDMVMGDTKLCPWDMGTFGSMTTRFFGPALRQAAANARAVLLELAAEHLQTSKDQLMVKDGLIFDKKQKKNYISYAQLTKGKLIQKELNTKAALKTSAEFKIIGKPVLRRDAIEKVTGKAEFAGDIRLPEMLYAKILRPPAHGAVLKNIDTTAAKKTSGVQIVQQENLIAVLHKYPDVAEQALSKIKSQFEKLAAKVDDKTIFEHLLKVAPQGEVVSEAGDTKQGEELAATVFEKTYLNSYVSHAPIEPHAAAAKIEGDKVTVWASTQAPFRVKNQIAETMKLPAKNIRIITPFVGGGFGGKTSSQQAIEAAQLAKITGSPVQVAWSRNEEFFFDTFRPSAVVKIRSGISDAGEIVFWDYHVYFAGERGSQHFYNIPHHRTMSYGSGWRSAPGSHPFRTGAWRAPANNSNTFARESQIDMMAVKAGVEAVEFRLRNLKDEKMRRVLKTAAEKFGWKPAKKRSGRGYGVACGIDAGTSVAAIAEVEVNTKNGHVQVKRVVCAQDMGLVINPEGAKIQMEGCITMGLGYALTEEIHFQGGEIFDINFDSYEIPRFSWIPQIETVIIDSKEKNAQGGGEPAIIVMGGVIANAIYDAIGVRLYQLPMTPQRILQALKKS